MLLLHHQTAIGLFVKLQIMKTLNYKGTEITSKNVKGCLKHFATLPNGKEIEDYYKPEIKRRINRFLEKGN